MSDAEELLDDRDAAAWAAVGGEASDFDPTTDTVEVPRDLFDRILGRLDDLEARVDQLENGSESVPDDAPPIVSYANIPADDREDLLSTSEQIAVALHQNWGDIAWKLGDDDNRRIGVDTKTKANAKYNPSRLKHRLKSELDRQFASTELYRGLRRLADLSGGDESTDRHSRVHITGGVYEYHHRPTIDGKDMKHVLYRESE